MYQRLHWAYKFIHYLSRIIVCSSLIWSFCSRVLKLLPSLHSAGVVTLFTVPICNCWWLFPNSNASSLSKYTKKKFDLEKFAKLWLVVGIKITTKCISSRSKFHWQLSNIWVVHAIVWSQTPCYSISDCKFENSITETYWIWNKLICSMHFLLLQKTMLIPL